MRVIFLSLLFLVLLGHSSAEQMAPINPKFLQWQDKQKTKSEVLAAKSGIQEHATGWRPSPLPEKVFKSGMYKSKRGVLPTKFDLSDPNLDGNRNDSMLTPITDQGNCGSCWAFATYGVHEGALKIDGLGVRDFSEQHLSYNNGTLWAADPCSGGNLQMSMAYLARGSGPVLEADDPFNIGGSSNVAASRNRYMDNIIELPIRNPADKMNAGWFTMIKEALYTTQKPLYVSMQVDGGSAGESGASVWENASKSYFCNGTVEQCESNHAVVIVGWDDTYAAQGQTGAFIIRNSWGLTWNNVTDGYYYVPYTDNSLAMDGTVAFFEDVDDATFNVTKIYQHDELPASYEYGGAGSTRWAANKYTITANESLIGVGFQALYPDTEYEVKFYTVSSGTHPSVRFSSPIGPTITSQAPVSIGWHTVVLDTPLDVQNGQTIIVQIKLSNPIGHPIPVEADIANYVNAESSYGESYYSSDGINFSDIKTLFEGFGYQDANIPIKLLVGTSGLVEIPCIYTINDPSQGFTASGGTHSVTVNATPANCNTGSWNSSENVSWAAFTGTTSGSGNGTWNVAYSVDSLAVPVGRIATLSIAGSTHTLYQRGTLNQQGMVFDERTGLYWQDEIYTAEENTAYNQLEESGKVLNWEHALAYCKARTQADLRWTLPTIAQLSSIVETSNSPTIAPAFQNPQSGVFWSATSTSTTTANSLDFTDGDVGAGAKGYPNYVRCVGRKGGVNPALIMYLLQ